jgi:hypothetical protein
MISVLKALGTLINALKKAPKETGITIHLKTIIVTLNLNVNLNLINFI